MAKRSSLWDEVEEIRKKDANARIQIAKAARVIERRPPGRPRKRPEGANAYFTWIMRTPAGGPMRCRNHGCNKKLRSTQEDLVCSEACRAELLRECEITLSILRGERRAREYPPDLRGLKNSRRRIERRAYV